MFTFKKLLVLTGTAIALTFSAFSQLALAEQVYKSTGKNGEVIYSNVAPGSDTNTQVVPIAPEPSVVDIEAAQQWLRETQEDASDQRLESAEANAINNVTEEEEQAPTPLPLAPVNPLIGLAPFL